MIKGEGLASKNGCVRPNKLGPSKRVMKRVQKEIRKKQEHLKRLNMNEKNLIKAINCRVISHAGYVMNVCDGKVIWAY